MDGCKTKNGSSMASHAPFLQAKSHQSTSLFSRVSLCWMVLRMGSVSGMDRWGCGGNAGPWYRAAGGDGNPFNSTGESPTCVSWNQHTKSQFYHIHMPTKSLLHLGFSGTAKTSLTARNITRLTFHPKWQHIKAQTCAVMPNIC